MENKKAIIFDFDGTLSDTVGAIAEAINLTMLRLGFNIKTQDEVLRAIGNGATIMIRRLIPENVSGDTEFVAYARSVYDEMYAKTYLHTVDTYEGIIPMLASLHNDKGMKIAVFSNKQDPYVKGLCDQLFSKDIISYALGQTELPIKPDPSGVFRILDALEVTAEECVFVGDSEVDYHTAKNAGIDFIGVTWGYAGRDRLIACGSEHLADKAEEILEIIK